MTPEVSRGAAQEKSSSVKFGDVEMEAIMGRLLQIGVLTAATVVMAGGAIYLWEHAGEQANYRNFTAIPIDLKHADVMVRAIGHGDAVSILELGILLLVATPVCRVIFAVVAFALERDRLYLMISLAVLAVLLFGLLRGA